MAPPRSTAPPSLHLRVLGREVGRVRGGEARIRLAHAADGRLRELLRPELPLRQPVLLLLREGDDADPLWGEVLRLGDVAGRLPVEEAAVRAEAEHGEIVRPRCLLQAIEGAHVPTLPTVGDLRREAAVLAAADAAVAGVVPRAARRYGDTRRRHMPYILIIQLLEML